MDPRNVINMYVLLSPPNPICKWPHHLEHAGTGGLNQGGPNVLPSGQNFPAGPKDEKNPFWNFFK
jgi:hypothetical protein